MIRLMIVDDDPLVASSLCTILGSQADFRVEAVEHSGDAAVAQFPRLQPDLVVMDIRMQGTNGLEAGKKILQRFPAARLLYLTTFADDEYIIQALHMGAKGYMLKQHYDCLVPAIRAVCGGQRVFGDEIVEKLPRLIKDTSLSEHSTFGLNEKEINILEKLAEGYSNREISQEIFLSEGTVRNYISSMLEKLGLRDRTQLAIFYYRNRKS